MSLQALKGFVADVVFNAASVFFSSLIAHAKALQESRDKRVPFIDFDGDFFTLVSKKNIASVHFDKALLAKFPHPFADSGLRKVHSTSDIDGMNRLMAQMEYMDGLKIHFG